MSFAHRVLRAPRSPFLSDLATYSWEPLMRGRGDPRVNTTLRPSVRRARTIAAHLPCAATSLYKCFYESIFFRDLWVVIHQWNLFCQCSRHFCVRWHRL
jgi:hypothetical protein